MLLLGLFSRFRSRLLPNGLNKSRQIVRAVHPCCGGGWFIRSLMNEGCVRAAPRERLYNSHSCYPCKNNSRKEYKGAGKLPSSCRGFVYKARSFLCTFMASPALMASSPNPAHAACTDGVGGISCNGRGLDRARHDLTSGVSLRGDPLALPKGLASW